MIRQNTIVKIKIREFCMNQLLQTQFFGGLQARIRGIFNLNDPRWGRGEDGSSNEKKPEPGSSGLSQSPSGQKGRNEGSGGQPPDLDELWRDLLNVVVQSHILVPALGSGKLFDK